MPGQPPEGQPVPADGALPGAAVDRLGSNPFGIYVHVPFCRTRCGYCDFNTYTAAELGSGASRESYPSLAIAEIRLAGRVLRGQAGTGQAGSGQAGTGQAGTGQVSTGTAEAAPGGPAGTVDTVFFGGGTPTLLPSADLAAILSAIADEFGLAPGAEVTAEANPETVDERALADLRGSGFTRLSLGMQSAAPHVLSVLDRVHQPGRPQQCAAWARAAGFEHVSLDLIYGTPGETADDWARSLDSAVSAGPDHISAYALIVEPGTRLAARIRRGELAAPDDDELADRYLVADEFLRSAGLSWYEVSNWAANEAARCRHNLRYWTGGDWWGIGPGAHSHVGGTRWWNVRHPAAYATRIAAGTSPGQAREILTASEQSMERIMLATRLADGCPLADLEPAGRAAAAAAVADGLARRADYAAGRLVLTTRGRLLADAVIRGLTG
jgi:putative oxygen-independent coproporphyrinogen III oxidase